MGGWLRWFRPGGARGAFSQRAAPDPPPLWGVALTAWRRRVEPGRPLELSVAAVVIRARNREDAEARGVGVALKAWPADSGYVHHAATVSVQDASRPVSPQDPLQLGGGSCDVYEF